jgi:YjjG family noncanonical pyrimidine nucleotidase
MHYATLLFDLDHTLLDADASEAASFDQTLRAAGVDEPSRYVARYAQINRALWAAVERNEITPDDVRVTRFARLVAAVGIDADPKSMADDYVAGMVANAELYPNARAVLETLSTHATLAIVTNGLGDVQRPRVEELGIAHYFDAVVISGEVATAKPGTAIYDLVFEQLGWPDKKKTLMIGDSLSSDIPGGINYGIATCWYNPTGKPRPPDIAIDHEITTLTQLPGLARDGLVRA